MVGVLVSKIGVHSHTPVKLKKLLIHKKNQHVPKIEIAEVTEPVISREYAKASVVAHLKSNALLMKLKALLELQTVSLSSSARV